MEKPTLQEIKEYFRAAETVVCLSSSKVVNLKYMTKRGMHDWEKKWWIDYENHPVYGNNSCLLFCTERGYAKILSYKKPKDFTITKSQLEQLHRQGNDYTRFDLEYLFPSVFEEEKKELVVGKWYKSFFNPKYHSSDREWGLINITEISNGRINYYGFFKNDYAEKDWCSDTNVFTEATRQEVEEAIEAEILKRYKNGDYVKCLANPTLSKNDIVCFTGEDKGYMLDGSFWIPINEGKQSLCAFRDGQFATIIPTISPQQAEEKLKELGVNVKIV